MQRLQAPAIDVPVPANSPAAASATTILVAPPPGGVPGGAGTAPGPSGPSPAPSRPPSAPQLPAFAPVLPLHPGPFRDKRRSLSEMANEQLRRGTKPRDPFAEGMGEAAVDDCLHAPGGVPSVTGLLAVPGLAARALSGRCAK